MKKSNILNISIFSLMSLMMIAGCGAVVNQDITPPASIPFSSMDMENHTHVYDQEVAIARYRCSGTDCGQAATYYKSCVCGDKGTETFSIGNASAHSYQFVLEGEYKTNYLAGEKVSVENMQAKLVCSKQDDEHIIDVNNLIIPSEGLKRGDKTAVIAYEYLGERYEKSISISVDAYRLSDVSLEARDGKMYYQIHGEYGEGYKEIVERARFSLTVWKDFFEIGKTNPVCTPINNGNHGTWAAEIDITDICPTNNIGEKLSRNVYWPHFFIENDLGILENKDLTFPQMDEYISAKLDESSTETYQIYRYYESNKKIYIPTVGKLCGETLPTVQYYYSTTSDELPAVGETYKIGSTSYTAGETMYMIHEADILEENETAIIRLYGKLRGFTSSDQFIRSIKFILREYWMTTSGTAQSVIFDSFKGNEMYFFGDYNVDVLNGTFTLDVNVSAMGFDYMSATGTTDGDGTNTSKSGVRYFRIHEDKGTTGDLKLKSTANHNKSVTVNGKKYTLYYNKDGSGYENVWGCVGFGVDKA